MLRDIKEYFKPPAPFKVLVTLFLLAALPAVVYLTLNQNQDIRKRAAEPVANSSLKQNEAEYIPGEVIVKFKIDPFGQSSGSSTDKKQAIADLKAKADQGPIPFQEVQEQTPQLASQTETPLKEINKKVKITAVEKVFKGKDTPENELARLKQKFASEIASGKRKIDEEQLLKNDLSKIYKLMLAPGVSVEKAVQELQMNPTVAYAEPNYKVYTMAIPEDTLFSQLWALHNTGQTGGTNDVDIDAPEAWDITKGSESIIVAVVDTGVDYTHPDLGGCLGPACKVIGGYNFLSNTADPMDDHGHGTHVAGTMAALENNRGIIGVCPECKILGVKFLGRDGTGSIFSAVQAIDYAVQNYAKVINNSWGGGAYTDTLQEVISNAYAAGVVVVAASGNNYAELERYPAALNDVLAVAATDFNDVKASYSNFGDWVDISAPGGGIMLSGQCRYAQTILSTITNGSIWDDYGSACGRIENEAKYITIGGTSMAAPHVSGAAGLLMALHPDWSAPVVAGHLKNTADWIYDKNPDLLGKIGSGRLNAYKALSQPPQPKVTLKSFAFQPTSETWPNGLLEPGESGNGTFTFINEGLTAYSIVVALSSTDPYIVSSPTTFDLGTMNIGEIKSTSQPYPITLTDNTPPGYKIPFTLSISFNDENNNAYNYTESFSYQVTSDIGWPKKERVAYPAMLFADLDKDGVNEVIMAHGNEHFFYEIQAYTSDGHLLWTYVLPNQHERIDVSYQTSPSFAVGDVDGDSYPEIVFGVWTGKLYVLEADGKVKANFPKG